MMPVHHVPDAILWAYATGAASEGESLLVATHAFLCPTCRQRINELERVGGALLVQTPPEAVSADLWLGTLERLTEQPAPARVTLPEAPPTTLAAEDPVLPPPLSRLLGSYDRLAWKRALERLHYVDLPLTHRGLPVRLRRLGPGMQVPLHSHRGSELELVLAGGAVDERDGSRFGRGDVAYNDESDTHSLRIDEDGECLILGVQDARLLPRGLWSRLVFGYLGW